MDKKLKIMLDTNVYDKLIEQKSEILGLLKDRTEIFITHVQYDQLREMSSKKLDKHKKIFEIIEYFNPNKIPTVSACFGMSNWDEVGWGDETGNFEAIQVNNINHSADALIAETAKKNECILITEEKGSTSLRNKSPRIDLECINFNELITKIEK